MYNGTLTYNGAQQTIHLSSTEQSTCIINLLQGIIINFEHQKSTETNNIKGKRYQHKQLSPRRPFFQELIADRD